MAAIRLDKGTKARFIWKYQSMLASASNSYDIVVKIVLVFDSC